MPRTARAAAIGEAGLNIATFALGRDSAGGYTVALVETDGAVPDGTLARIAGVPGVKATHVLRF